MTYLIIYLISIPITYYYGRWAIFGKDRTQTWGDVFYMLLISFGSIVIILVIIYFQTRDSSFFDKKPPRWL
jgi:hypothetical protein